MYVYVCIHIYIYVCECVGGWVGVGVWVGGCGWVGGWVGGCVRRYKGVAEYIYRKVTGNTEYIYRMVTGNTNAEISRSTDISIARGCIYSGVRGDLGYESIQTYIL